MRDHYIQSPPLRELSNNILYVMPGDIGGFTQEYVYSLLLNLNGVYLGIRAEQPQDTFGDAFLSAFKYLGPEDADGRDISGLFIPECSLQTQGNDVSIRTTLRNARIWYRWFAENRPDNVTLTAIRVASGAISSVSAPNPGYYFNKGCTALGVRAPMRLTLPGEQEQQFLNVVSVASFAGLPPAEMLHERLTSGLYPVLSQCWPIPHETWSEPEDFPTKINIFRNSALRLL